MLKLMPKRNYEETLQEIKRLVKETRPEITITATEKFDSSVFKTDPWHLRVNIIFERDGKGDLDIMEILDLFFYMLQKNYGVIIPETDEDFGCTVYVRPVGSRNGKFNSGHRVLMSQAPVTIYKDGVWYV